MIVRFIRDRRSYWGEPPLGCKCGAILPIRADSVQEGSGVTCISCGTSVVFDAADTDAIAAELVRLKNAPTKPPKE